MSEFTLVPADTIAAADLHAAFVGAFADYIAGPFTLELPEWPALLARHAVDLAESRAAVQDGQVVAFAQVAPRRIGRRWRLAALGALPAARGGGAAKALLDDFIARAAQAAQVAVELECFAQNDRALGLYRQRKFVVRHELAGWTLPAETASPEPVRAAASRELERAAAFAWLDAAERRIGELPLQVCAQGLEAVTRPLTFFQRGTALLAWSDTGDGPIQVHSLIDGGVAQADAEALIAAVRATRPEAGVTMPPLHRVDLCGAALERAGFARQPRHQVLMVRGPAA